MDVVSLEADSMGWREFRTLLNGLGPNSAFVTVMGNKKNKKNGKYRKPVEREITDAAEGEKYVSSLFGSM